MENNNTGGRKEATGVWAWKLETLDPGQTYVIKFSLAGLEKGDWTDTDVFFRGSQDVIGATKMDEKLLEEIRRQEAAANGDEEEEAADELPIEESKPLPAPEVPPPNGQQTLFGGGE